MAYKHGVYTSEVPTTILPQITVAAPTVAFGTAPVHLATAPAAANVPVLCTSLAEFVTQFGWSDDFDKYTLCEAAQVHLQLFRTSPVIFVNVLDTDTHSKSSTATVEGVSTPVTLTAPIILSTLKVTSGTGATLVDLKAGEDYTAEHDASGNVTLTFISLSKVVDDKVALSYKEVDASAVTASDIIGGVDVTTGKNTGLELVEEVYPRTGLIPGTLIAPKWSTNPAVAAMLKAKAQEINGVFRAMAIADIPTASAPRYTAVNAVKNTNNLVDPHLIVTYPMVALGGVKYHLSTQVAALCGQVDAAHDDIPYKSPSNEELQCDQSCLADGSDIFLGKSQANYLNGLGVVTALNFVGGWRCWGNRTSAYPASSDVKDNFIPVRRMFNWISNTLVTSFWSRIDMPVNRRLVESVVDSANIWLNGLTARGALVGGRVEFLDTENPQTDLLDGIIKFHVYIAPPVPAREISFVQEYDASYLSTLFS